ncbi:thylakoid membrane protein TERC, chloroplastic isoform X3 [Henckelia pumila]|uniref:thylakoid membrane protein TERC, chloroplastic isoform X3 n=1 Tax=Henckelia pumila TaxID=405737 RepID=UPI003C6E2CB2
MKLASTTIHANATRFPSTLLKSSPSTSVRIRFALRHSYPFLPAGCVCGRDVSYCSTFVSARRTEREQEASVPSKESTRSQSHEGIDRNDSSCNDSSSSDSGEVTLSTADYSSSLRTVALCVFSAVVFGIGLGFKDGVSKASEFFTGYLLEQSLSVDNLFVFVLIFNYFKVPLDYQNRVLSYGIAGAIIFRLSLILLGTATLQRFEAVNLLLAAILLYSSFKLFAAGDEDTDLSNNFIVKTCQKFIPVTSDYDGNRFITLQDGMWKATPLLLTVAVIELSDIAFAVDSIPAVFGVTRDPFIVYTSNLFAILGLRSYYTLISAKMAELEYLQPAIGVILGFIGSKMILDFFGFHIPTEVSLGFVAASLGTGVSLSLLKKSDE